MIFGRSYYDSEKIRDFPHVLLHFEISNSKQVRNYTDQQRNEYLLLSVYLFLINIIEIKIVL